MQYIHHSITLWTVSCLVILHHIVLYHITISYYNTLHYITLQYIQFYEITYTRCLQDIWLRRHVAALDSVVSLYLNPADLATKAFTTDKVTLHL